MINLSEGIFCYGFTKYLTRGFAYIDKAYNMSNATSPIA
ncbi:hypothetical protein KPK_A0086 (plasmid) [Klebsiella variicola]|uniref:Uncharacterized protein n=1 Tax=Klebsiella variicola (strain 342) TaxID=507522 RepID=B5RK10_KLEV3|nr:hypothetical protein KPK_A0086 [Klebsiella variicola]